MKTPSISDDSWREFWRWVVAELRDLRNRAEAKYPAHVKHLRLIQSRGKITVNGRQRKWIRTKGRLG